MFLKETLLVGLGAIGNGLIWTLRKFSNLRGEIILVDHENVALSNLQRYAISTQDNLRKSKVEMAAEFLQSSAFQVQKEPYKLAGYASKRSN